MKLLSFFMAFFLLIGCGAIAEDTVRPWAPIAPPSIVIDGYTIPPYNHTLQEKSPLKAGQERRVNFICDGPKGAINLAEGYTASMDRGNQLANIYIAKGICVVLPQPVIFRLVERIYMYVDAEKDIIGIWSVKYKNADEKLFYALMAVESYKASPVNLR